MALLLRWLTNSTSTIGNLDTLFTASFGGSDTTSIIGSAVLPTIKVAIPERVGPAGFEPATFRL